MASQPICPTAAFIPIASLFNAYYQLTVFYKEFDDKELYTIERIKRLAIVFTTFLYATILYNNRIAWICGSYNSMTAWGVWTFFTVLIPYCIYNEIGFSSVFKKEVQEAIIGKEKSEEESD